MKCASYKCKKERLDIAFVISDTNQDWGYCQNCLNKELACKCCGSLNHSDSEHLEVRCEDWCHKVAEGVASDFIYGADKELILTAIGDLGCQRKCSHYEKYLAPILKDNCDCCGWICVKQVDTHCEYEWCGGQSEADNKCRFRKTCEDYWKDKENERKRQNISKEEFYAKNINKPKQRFNCSHFQKIQQKEAQIEVLPK